MVGISAGRHQACGGQGKEATKVKTPYYNSRDHGSSEDKMASWAGTPPTTSCCALQHAQASLTGLLQVGKFTVLSVQSYDPEVHFSFSDLAMDSHTAPSLFHIRREPSKTDLFRQGADIHNSGGN